MGLEWVWFVPTWLRQVTPPPASQNHFNHCNSLPAELRDPIISLAQFRRALTTHLFVFKLSHAPSDFSFLARSTDILTYLFTYLLTYLRNFRFSTLSTPSVIDIKAVWMKLSQKIAGVRVFFVTPCTYVVCSRMQLRESYTAR